LKGLRRLVATGLPIIAAGGIERDEIYLRRQPLQQSSDRMRMVSAVEGRALMGFPAHYQLPANEAQAWTLLGNAVCPPMAAELIGALRRAA
jgi:site-specific DNA-cytosine methylase